VIILSGHAYEQDHARAKATGATAFLTKPVEADELIALVHRLLVQPVRDVD
jgi:CheY-like chemotaxis protein